MIKIEKDGYKEIRSINAKDVNRIKDTKSYMYRNLSDSEKLNLIFRELGYNMNTQQIQKISEKLSLSQIGNMHTEKTYIEVDENGNQQNVSESKAVEAAKIRNEKFAELKSTEYQRIMTMSDISPTTSNGNAVPVIDEKNYMAQMIFVIYTPNYNGKGTTPGRYAAIATFEWLKAPTIQGTDCMGMYTGQFNWIDRIPGDDSNYFFMSSYKKGYLDINGNYLPTEEINEFKEEDEAIISNTSGFCFSYKLPGYIPQVMYSNFTFMIFGICRVKNYNDADQSLSISSEYVHITNLATIGLSFSIGPLGIDVSGFLPGAKPFPGAHEWNYKIDYYA